MTGNIESLNGAEDAEKQTLVNLRANLVYKGEHNLIHMYLG